MRAFRKRAAGDTRGKCSSTKCCTRSKSSSQATKMIQTPAATNNARCTSDSYRCKAREQNYIDAPKACAGAHKRVAYYAVPCRMRTFAN